MKKDIVIEKVMEKVRKELDNAEGMDFLIKWRKYKFLFGV